MSERILRWRLEESKVAPCLLVRLSTDVRRGQYWFWEDEAWRLADRDIRIELLTADELERGMGANPGGVAWLRVQVALKLGQRTEGYDLPGAYFVGEVLNHLCPDAQVYRVDPGNDTLLAFAEPDRDREFQLWIQAANPFAVRPHGA